MQRLAAYRQAQEFAHFGSDMSDESRQTLELGRQLHEVLRQAPNELCSIAEQELMLRTVVIGEGRRSLNVLSLKQQAKELAPTVQNEQDMDRISKELLEKSVVEAAA